MTVAAGSPCLAGSGLFLCTTATATATDHRNRLSLVRLPHTTITAHVPVVALPVPHRLPTAFIYGSHAVRNLIQTAYPGKNFETQMVRI